MKKVILFSDVKSAMKKCLSVILAALTMLTLLSLTGCAKKIGIDLEKCTSISVRGYDDEGTASVDIDENYILPLLGDMNMMSAASIINSLHTEPIDNNGSLSNGDKITVTIRCDEETLKNANVSVSNTKLTFVVEGLSKYITSPADLTDSDRETLMKIAEESINSEVEKLNSGSGSVLYIGSILKDLSGVDIGISTSTKRKVNIDNLQFLSAYVGSKDDPTTQAWNVPRCAAYYFFSFDVNYEITREASIFSSALDIKDKGSYIVAVCINTPEKSAEGLKNSLVTPMLGSTDFDTAYGNVIPSEGFTVVQLQ